MNPWIHLTSILSLTAVAAAAPRTKTCYTSPPTTVTKLVTQTCPAPKTVYLDIAGNTVAAPAPTNPASYVTTLAGVTKITQMVYPASVTCYAGETVTIGGVPTVIAGGAGSTVLSNCPCSMQKTVVAPGPVVTLPAAFAPGANAGGNAGGAVGGGASTVINTYYVYPTAFIGNGGETLTISGTQTVLPSATVIDQCPCTQATTITVVGPTVTNTVTQFVPVITVIGGATLTSTATVISGVTVTATTTETATAGPGVPAAGTFVTTVDGTTFLVEEQINYDGIPLALPARKNKRQNVGVSLQVCLQTCADEVSCAGSSLNSDSSTCLYFSAIFRSTRRRDVTIIFATVISRITPTGTSSLSSSSSSATSITTTSATSTSGTSTSGTSTSGTSTTENGGTSTSGTSTSASSTSGTSTSGTATTSQTADPSSDPDVPAEEEVVARAAAPRPAGLTLREAHRNKAGAVVRRGGVLRRSNAEPAAKHAPRKVVIEL